MGSGTIKAGIAGEEKPTCVFDSLIGHAKFNQILPVNVEKEVVGPEKETRGLYRLDYPIKRGILSSATNA